MKILKKILISLGLNGLALYATAQFLENLSIVGGLKTYIIASVIIAAVNLSIKPALKILSFPLKYATLGLSIILINIIAFYLVDQIMNYQFGIQYDILIQENLVTYVKSGIIFGVINWIEHLIIK